MACTHVAANAGPGTENNASWGFLLAFTAIAAATGPKRLPPSESPPPRENDQVVATIGPDVGLRAALLTPPGDEKHVGQIHGLLAPAAGAAELLMEGHAAADSLTRLGD